METKAIWNNEHTAELGIISINGREFSALGSVIESDHAAGYLKQANGETSITSWNGEKLGDARIVSTWSLPRTCWISDRMHQVEATINGKTYTGRCAGSGMLWRGRIKKGSK